MPRQKISRAEFEQRLDGQVDPVSQLPPGFPPTHSKISPTPSKFVVAAVQRVFDAGVQEDAPDAAELELRGRIRTSFHRVSRRR
jgi:hypothetical protein